MQPTVLNGKRVLLVEDNAINAEIATIILEQYGIAVDHAENGRIGADKVKIAEAGHYSAVLMDIQMPVMNGYEATRAIRSFSGEYYQTLPIIAMSANAYDEDIQASLDAGMNAHIAKPFQPADLIKTLYRYMADS
jgi:CheY-like chemotaxis protein